MSQLLLLLLCLSPRIFRKNKKLKSTRKSGSKTSPLVLLLRGAAVATLKKRFVSTGKQRIKMRKRKTGKVPRAKTVSANDSYYAPVSLVQKERGKVAKICPFDAFAFLGLLDDDDSDEIADDEEDNIPAQHLWEPNSDSDYASQKDQAKRVQSRLFSAFFWGFFPDDRNTKTTAGDDKAKQTGKVSGTTRTATTNDLYDTVTSTLFLCLPATWSPHITITASTSSRSICHQTSPTTSCSNSNLCCFPLGMAVLMWQVQPALANSCGSGQSVGGNNVLLGVSTILSRVSRLPQMARSWVYVALLAHSLQCNCDWMPSPSTIRLLHGLRRTNSIIDSLSKVCYIWHVWYSQTNTHP